MLRSFFCAALFVSVLAPAIAQAAVYKCVTAEGVARFSSKPCPAKALEGSTEAHQLYRALQAKLAEGGSIISSAQGGTTQILQCQKQQRVYLDRLAVFEDRVKAQEQRFKGFQSSYDFLKGCGACQARARRACSDAAAALSQVKSGIVSSQVKMERPGWARRYD